MNILPAHGGGRVSLCFSRSWRLLLMITMMTSLIFSHVSEAQQTNLDQKNFHPRFDFLNTIQHDNSFLAHMEEQRQDSPWVPILVSEQTQHTDAEKPKAKDLIERIGGMPMDVPPLLDDPVDPPESASNSTEQDPTRVEGPEPKDLIERIGGMPMNVPSALNNPVDPRQQAILQRQRVLNKFNPALGVVFEPIYGYSRHRQRFVSGDGPDAGRETGTRLPKDSSAALRTIELFAAADVDTFARAYMIASGHAEAINESGSEEFGKASFEIEEAAIQTTSLPFNLSVRGGRFFADWGYLGRRHAHDLPQIDVPPSLQQLFLNNRTDGLEVNWLVPVPFYFNLSAGWGYNFGQLGEGPLAPFQQQVAHGDVLFGSARTYFDLDDDHNIELGFSGLYTPNSNVPEAEETALLAVDSDDDIDRYVLNWDFHYRWYPLGRGLRQSLSLHAEILYDWGQGRRDELGRTGSQGAWGGYTYLEYRISKRWRPGFRFDYHQLPSEPALVSNPFSGRVGSTANSKGERTDVRTYSPYITFYPSEFQRFVLQYNHSSWGNAKNNDQVVFQWQVVIGSHQHGFTERD